MPPYATPHPLDDTEHRPVTEASRNARCSAGLTCRPRADAADFKNVNRQGMGLLVALRRPVAKMVRRD